MKKVIILSLLCFLFSVYHSQVIYTVHTPTLLSQNSNDVKIITKVYFGNYAVNNNHSVSVDHVNKKVNLVSCYNYMAVFPLAPTIIHTVNIVALSSGTYNLNYTVFTVINYTSCESPEDTTANTYQFYVNPSGVQEHKNDPQFKIAPNPVKDSFKFFGDIHTDFEKLEVVNLLGNTVIELNDPAIHSNVNVTMLPKGVYFVRVYANNQTLIQKIIKE